MSHRTKKTAKRSCGPPTATRLGVIDQSVPLADFLTGKARPPVIKYTQPYRLGSRARLGLKRACIVPGDLANYSWAEEQQTPASRHLRASLRTIEHDAKIVITVTRQDMERSAEGDARRPASLDLDGFLDKLTLPNDPDTWDPTNRAIVRIRITATLRMKPGTAVDTTSLPPARSVDQALADLRACVEGIHMSQAQGGGAAASGNSQQLALNNWQGPGTAAPGLLTVAGHALAQLNGSNLVAAAGAAAPAAGAGIAATPHPTQPQLSMLLLGTCLPGVTSLASFVAVCGASTADTVAAVSAAPHILAPSARLARALCNHSVASTGSAVLPALATNSPSNALTVLAGLAELGNWEWQDTSKHYRAVDSVASAIIRQQELSGRLDLEDLEDIIQTEERFGNQEGQDLEWSTDDTSAIASEEELVYGDEDMVLVAGQGDTGAAGKDEDEERQQQPVEEQE